METVKIRTLKDNQFEVDSFDNFELLGEKFHITQSQDNHLLYTVTHEGTGFCISVDSTTVESAKKDGIEYLKNKGEKKLRKGIRKSKLFLFKQKYLSKMSIKKITRALYIIWQIFCALIAISIIALAIFKIVTKEVVNIELSF